MNRLQFSNNSDSLITIPQKINHNILNRIFDSYIQDILQSGNQFFFITINLYNIPINKNNEYQIEQRIQFETHKLINRFNQIPLVDHYFIVTETLYDNHLFALRKLNNENKQIRNENKQIKKQNDLLRFKGANKNDLISFKQFSKLSSKNQKPTVVNYPHFHIIITFKKILPVINECESQLNSMLLRYIQEYPDVSIQRLFGFESIKIRFRYIAKQFNEFRLTPTFTVGACSIIEPNFKILTNFLTKLKQVNFNFEHSINEQIPTKLELFDYKHINLNIANDIPSFNFYKAKEINILIYYINLCFNFYNYKLYKNQIFKISPRSKKAVFRYSELTQYITTQLKPELNNIFQIFNYHTFNDYINAIINNNLNILFKSENINIFFNQSEINFDYIEFNDGFYNLTTGGLTTKIPDLWCCFYFDKWYKNLNLSITKTIWYKFLKKQLNKNQITQLAADLGYLMCSRVINDKKNVIYIEGVSNSGKTTLIMNIVESFWGTNLIGQLSNDRNFGNEDIEHSEVIVNDEFEYKPHMRGNLLKLFEGSAILVNRKHKKATKTKKHIKILLGANKDVIIYAHKDNTIEEDFKNLQNNVQLTEDKAFFNRIQKYEFKKSIMISQAQYKQILRDFPKILIYCNKQFLQRQKIFNQNEAKNNIDIFNIDEESDNENPNKTIPIQLTNNSSQISFGEQMYEKMFGPETEKNLNYRKNRKKPTKDKPSIFDSLVRKG